MKRFISLLICIALIISCLCISIITKAEEKIYDTSDFALSSIDFTGQKIRIGYNFGNTFESTELRGSYTRPNFDNMADFIKYKETHMGDSQMSENLIKYAKSIGIQAIRIPITWFNVLLDENGNLYPKNTWYSDIDTRRDAWFNGTIAPEFLARIKEVVDMIINNDMYVIINTHHDAAVNSSNAVNPIKFGSDVQTSTKYEGMTNQEQTIRYLTNIWSQVGEYFKDYGSRLLFEEYNEASNNSGSMTANDANASDAKEVTKSFIQLIRSQGSNNANRFLVLPNYGGVSFWNADIWNGTTTNESVFEYNQSIPSYDTADDKLIMTTHVYTSSGQMSGSISYAKTMMNRTGCGAIIDEIGTLSNAPYSEEGIAVCKNIRKYSDEYEVGCFYWDGDTSNLINRRYQTPISCEALGGFVGKDLGQDIVYTDISQMLDEEQQSWIKLYSPDSNTEWGKKYLIIVSKNPVTKMAVSKNKSSSIGYLTPEGCNDGPMTFYMSDDGVNYYRNHTVIPSSWTRIAWDCYKAYGTTPNTVLIDGTNYCYNDYYFVEDFTREGTIEFTEATDDGICSLLKSTNVQTGQTCTLSSKFTLDKGVYDTQMIVRSYSGRAKIDMSINGQLVAQDLDTGTKNGSVKPYDLPELTITEDNTPIIIDITAKTNGTLWIDYMSFRKQGAPNGADIPIPTTTQTATVIETTTVQTPTTTVTEPTTSASTTAQTTESQDTNEAVIVETGEKYETLKTAFSNAAAGQTIRLLKDITTKQYEYTTYSLKKELTLDLGGHTINSQSQRLFDLQSADYKFVIKNGTIKQVAAGRSDKPGVIEFDFFFILRAKVKFEIENMTFDTNGFKPSYGYQGCVVYISSPSSSDDTGTLKLKLTNSSFIDNSGASASLIGSNSTVAFNTEVYNCNFESTNKAFDGLNFATTSGTFKIYSAHIKAGNKFPSSANKAIVIADGSYVSLTDSGEEIDGLVNENGSLNLTKWSTLSEVYVNVKNSIPSVLYGMEFGASIRLNSVSGIRFYTNVNKEKISELRAQGYTVELGTLISPKDLIGDNELTFDLDSTDYVDVPFESEKYFEQGDFSGVVGSIIDIKPENITREFVGRGYAKITKDGVTIIEYANYNNSDIANNSRSLAYVAYMFKNDATSFYGDLAANIKELVDSWAKKYN